jgi:hypothetical protein
MYSVLNACRILYAHGEREDERLFAVLCEAVPDLLPRMIHAGTGMDGMARIIVAARDWVEREHGRDLAWFRPTFRARFSSPESFFGRLRYELSRTDDGPRVAIIGLDKPWYHWTVVRSVGEHGATFLDSWGFPEQAPFDAFTLEPDEAGEGPYQKTLLAQHRTFLLASVSTAASR